MVHVNVSSLDIHVYHFESMSSCTLGTQFGAVFFEHYELLKQEWISSSETKRELKKLLKIIQHR